MEKKNIQRYPDKSLPLISIITPVLNGAAYLEETINSVINQDYPNFEYIIIDGGSTDRTKDIIKKYEDKIGFWKSEKDDGMYDAINKGLKIAKGDILAYINYDDVYAGANVLSRIAEIFMKNKKTDWTYSDFFVINSSSKILYSYRAPEVLANYKMLRAAGYSYIYQPTVFWRRKVFEESGFFDTNFKMAADYEFFLRIIQKHELKKVSFKVTRVRFHDATKTNTLQSLNNEERKKILNKYSQREKKIELFLKFVLFFIIKFSNIDNYLKRTIYKIRGTN